MNERYLFRGQRVDTKEWVYGYLLPKFDGVYIDLCESFENDGGTSLNVFKVIPETVGQWTTLKDKNGQSVFEGDIIKYDDTEEMSFWTRGEIGVVKFKPGRFSICLSPDYDGKMTGTSNMMQEDMEDCITIIGNIHQNSELLEKGGK